MITLDGNLVVGLAAALLLVAGWLATNRPTPRALGLTIGALLTLAGLVIELARPVGLPLLLDAVSIPRISFAGLVLVGVAAVLPARHASWRAIVAVVALTLASLALAMTAPGPAQAAWWALTCALSGAVLPAGPARRLAVPYLTLAGGAGVAGIALGGAAGDALMVLAAGVRLGVFPFHTWVVGAYPLAPTTLAVALTGPMASLGLIARFPLGFEGTPEHVAMVLLPIAAIVTAGLAMVQRELARAIGLITVSVQTLVFLGVLDSDDVGHLGGLIMWSVTGLSLTGLGLIAAALRSRLGSVDLTRHSGLLPRTPTLATLFLLFGMTAVGAPGTADFVSADLVLHGAMSHDYGLLILYIAAVSTQAYTLMHLFFRVFLGPRTVTDVVDALPRERHALALIAVLLVVTGLAPQLLAAGWLMGGEAGHALAAVDLTP